MSALSIFVTAGVTQSNRCKSNGVHLLACAALLGLACGDVYAAFDNEIAGPEIARASLQDGPMARMEMSSSTSPNFDATDGSIGTTRMDVTAWGRDSRQSSFGLSVGANRPSGYFVDPQQAQTGTSLGVRWRTPLSSSLQLDMGAWHTVTPGGNSNLTVSDRIVENSTYGTQVEMQFLSPRDKGLHFERGAIGMSMSRTTSFTLRSRGGKPMLYYRLKF